MLYSLYNSDIYAYASLLKDLLGVYNCEKIFILYFSALIVKKYCPDKFDDIQLDVDDFSIEVYRMLLKLLFAGKACCHLENEAEWEWVRTYYQARIEKYVQKMKWKIVTEKGEV